MGIEIVLIFESSFNQNKDIMYLLNLESADITGTIRISYNEDSYQFAQDFIAVTDEVSFEDIKTTATATIDKQRLYRKGNYWATFCQLQPDGKYVEIVNQRMK